jgi:hypothetical protein
MINIAHIKATNTYIEDYPTEDFKINTTHQKGTHFAYAVFALELH